MCYDFAALYDPETDTFEAQIQVNGHAQALRNSVNDLVNDGEIDPEEAQYLRDDITELQDRLEHHTTG